MKSIFLQILDMSVSASILAAMVMVLRFALKKAPKAIHCVLWAMVALRLVCPVLPQSNTSLMPDSHPVSAAVQQAEDKTAAPQIQTPQQSVPQEPMNPEPAPKLPVREETVTSIQEPEQPLDWINILSVIWLSGVGVMALYGLGSYLYLRRKVAPAVQEDDVWLCDHIPSPFILGILRPRIYLPSDLDEACRESVLAHEKAHLRRKDHWWKPLGFALLAVHWFNPVMWVAYTFLCRDIEAACDQRVVKGMEPGERKAYSEALLSCAAPRRSIAACPLAFGEQGVKGRIKSVLSYKKPTLWIILIALIASVAVGVFFLTNPVDKDDSPNIRSTEVLRELVPQYFEYGDDGAELYIWEENGELLCGVLPITSRLKTEEEIRGLTGIALEEMAVILDTYSVPDWHVVVTLYGTSQYWTEEQSRNYRDIIDLFYARLGLYFPEENEIIGNFTVATEEDIQPVFGDGFFYAKGYNGLYRVYCTDMEGIAPGKRVSISYVDKKDLDGTVQHEITAKKIFVYTAKSKETATIDMEIAQSVPSGLAFQSNCFYATSSGGQFYRVYCSDMTGLYQGQAVRVTYSSSSLRMLEYPGGYPDGGYTPQYEITAIAVEDRYGYEADYYTTVYYRWEDPLDAVLPTYYAAPVTKEEWELLSNITKKSRAWQDSVTSSDLLYPTTDFVVLQNGSWWPFGISGEKYIVKGEQYSLLTQEEQELIIDLKNRAYESGEAKGYFTRDIWQEYSLPIQ